MHIFGEVARSRERNFRAGFVIRLIQLSVTTIILDIVQRRTSQKLQSTCAADSRCIFQQCINNGRNQVVRRRENVALPRSF